MGIRSCKAPVCHVLVIRFTSGAINRRAGLDSRPSFMPDAANAMTKKLTEHFLRSLKIGDGVSVLARDEPLAARDDSPVGELFGAADESDWLPAKVTAVRHVEPETNEDVFRISITLESNIAGVPKEVEYAVGQREEIRLREKGQRHLKVRR